MFAGLRKSPADSTSGELRKTSIRTRCLAVNHEMIKIVDKKEQAADMAACFD
jgi:hypothetical protein